MAGKRKPVPKIKDELDYFKHQLDGIRKMIFMTSFILADEMGLGKSIQAATVAAVAFKLNQAKRILVVTSASLKGNWSDELDERCLFSWEILEGGPTVRIEQLEKFKSDVLIVNYEQVVSHLDKLNAMKFDIAIFDEIHMIQNNRSKRTKAVLKLKQPRRFLLTGTPVLNYVNGIWPLMNLVAPHEFPNYYTFINRYAVFGGYQDKQIVGVKNEAELKAKIEPYMLRRLKDDCMDLPKKLVSQVYLDMLPEQQKLYDIAETEMELPDPNGADPMVISNAMTKIMRLKQICATPACIGHPDVSSKLDWAVSKSISAAQQGYPVIIFTQFRAVIAALEKRFADLGTDTSTLHGDVKKEDRQQVVRKWEADAKNGNPHPILCMYQVGGTGYNMTAADTVIAIDKLWVPLLQDQAYDRAHRIGQTRMVNVFELIMKKTVEQKIEKIHKVKRGLFGSIIPTDTDTSWKRLVLQSIKEKDYD